MKSCKECMHNVACSDTYFRNHGKTCELHVKREDFILKSDLLKFLQGFETIPQTSALALKIMLIEQIKRL